VELLIKDLAVKKQEMDAVREVMKVEENKCEAKATSATHIKEDCEKELAKAMPNLEAAIKALDTLEKKDITELKNLKKPPLGVHVVMEGVAILMGVTPVKKSHGDGPDYWEPAKKELLGDTHFLKNLKNFDKDNIPEKVGATLRKSMEKNNAHMEPKIAAKASKAAEGLCKWVLAIEVYDRVAKEVEPKKVTRLLLRISHSIVFVVFQPPPPVELAPVVHHTQPCPCH
jgi:dynein heavy chain